MNKNIMEQVGFEKEVKLFEEKKCVFCKEPINMDDFEDEISKREYFISGICQKCQHEVFG